MIDYKPCPLCNHLMFAKPIDEDIKSYSCKNKIISVSSGDYPHYQFIDATQIGSSRHWMIVMPYLITTYDDDDYSIIQKYIPGNTGHFDYIDDTRSLNIGPIQPMSEKQLLNRINTLLVFS